MKLYLLRHGEAQARAASDSQRQLTPHGVDDVRMVARQFAAKGVTLDRCFVSPYVRAAETATEFLRELHSDLPQESQALLKPEVRALEVMRFLQGVHDHHVLLVSHNPLLSELTALLTEGSIENLRILSTAELVCVALDGIGLGAGTAVYRLLPSDHAWHD
ncbi:MAG: phosphohistidine phosphatase SixA [Pseudomonadales bacterium]|jgi:phosphohistidine phosphatase|nr:phosphohistidine phosphatase SixA [Pseudomonadales bacterium]